MRFSFKDLEVMNTNNALATQPGVKTMTVFCIVSDIRPISDMYHRIAVVVMIHI